MPAEKKVEKEAKKSVKEYKVIGEGFKRREDAEKTLKKILDKGFKGAGLMVRKNEFVILFGTYQTEGAARGMLQQYRRQGLLRKLQGCKGTGGRCYPAACYILCVCNLNNIFPAINIDIFA